MTYLVGHVFAGHVLILREQLVALPAGLLLHRGGVFEIRDVSFSLGRAISELGKAVDVPVLVIGVDVREEVLYRLAGYRALRLAFKPDLFGALVVFRDSWFDASPGI